MKYATFEREIVFATALAFAGLLAGEPQTGSNSPSPAPASANPAPAASPGGGSSGSYSIEAEIFAYKSLQVNSRAIAQDVVGQLGVPGADGVSPPPVSTPGGDSAGGKRSKPKKNASQHAQAASLLPASSAEASGGAKAAANDAKPGATPKDPPHDRPGVVMAPSVSTILPAFQLWRSNMLVIQQFLFQAQLTLGQTPCPASPQASEKTETTITGPAFSTYATATSQAVSTIQGLLQLFATNETVSEFPGTIQDQALMSAVARELRARSVEVVMPDTFAPWTIDTLVSDSPFIAALMALIQRHGCLQDASQQNQLKVRVASHLQTSEVTRDTDYAKLIDTSLNLTGPQKLAAQEEILSLNNLIGDLRKRLGLTNLDTINKDEDGLADAWRNLIDAAAKDAAAKDAASKATTAQEAADKASSGDKAAAQRAAAAAKDAAAKAATAAKSADDKAADAKTTVRRLEADISRSENRAATEAAVTAAKAQSLVTGVEGYLAGLTGGAVSFTPPAAPAATPAPATPSASGAGAPQPSPATPAANTIPSSTSPAPATPPILAILSADGLARRMGVPGWDERTQGGNQSAWKFDKWRLLWVKALESGGAMITESNILGSHPHFGGGAVSGYALFSLDGTLACSGNAAAYGGYVKAKDFVKDNLLKNGDVRSATQMLYLGGGCGPL
jgi:hypothetical protein